MSKKNAPLAPELNLTTKQVVPTKFRFKHIEITPRWQNSAYTRLWKKLMQLLSEGWEIEYIEYKHRVKTKQGYKFVACCKGTAKPRRMKDV